MSFKTVFKRRGYEPKEERMEIKVKQYNSLDLKELLMYQNFQIEELDGDVLKVCRVDEQPIYISYRENNLYFQVDLGALQGVNNQTLLLELLDANTEIVPISFGIDNTEANDSRLVLVASLLTVDMSDEEVLLVIDAMELATDRAESILSKHIKA